MAYACPLMNCFLIQAEILYVYLSLSPFFNVLFVIAGNFKISKLLRHQSISEIKWKSTGSLENFNLQKYERHGNKFISTL